MVDFQNSLTATTTYVPLSCSCGCKHAEFLFSDGCFRVGFYPCNCPKYRAHTVTSDGLQEYLHIPASWLAEIHHGTYVLDPAWKARAEARKKELGNRCVVCSTQYNLEVHHNTYRNIGHELPNDLTVLCGKDHELFTKFGRLPKRTGVYKGRIKLSRRHWIEEHSSFVLAFIVFEEFIYENSFDERPSDLEKYFMGLFDLMFDDRVVKKLMDYFIDLCESKAEWLRIFFPHGVVALQ